MVGAQRCLVLALLVVGGCKEEGRRPCPAQGLGVQAASGMLCSKVEQDDVADIEDCRHQLEHFDAYDCQAPQMVPHQGWLTAESTVTSPPGIPGGSPEHIPVGLSLLLTNGSVGDQDLVLGEVTIFGDPRCAFVHDPQKGLDRTTIPPGETAVLGLVYRPTEGGEDHGLLRVRSNAANLDPLDVLICGRAMWTFAPGLDSGPPWTPDAGASGAGGMGFTCKEVKAELAPCHQ
jgi:hypothetical protein